MQEQASLADLLRIVLGSDPGGPVAATAAFANWAPGSVWPPAASVPASDGTGLWLLDTADDPALRVLSRDIPPSFEMALVLARSGQRRSLRRMLSDVRRRVPRRAPASRVAGAVGGSAHWSVHTLSYSDESHVPTDYDLVDRHGTAGAAFLLTRHSPFKGPIWSHVANRLDAPDVRILGFQLRARGAGVVLVEALGRSYVVRLVPAGPLRQVVLKNHTALIELRAGLKGIDSLLHRIPEPLFADTVGPALVLGETRLEGELAWRIALRAHASKIRLESLAFLHSFAEATRHAAGGADTVAAMMQSDGQRLEVSEFAGSQSRSAIRRELQRGLEALSSHELAPHASHGDYGYGNILVNAGSGALTGVIDWDTARSSDFPGIDRVNLEIQIRRTVARQSFPDAVSTVWRERLAHESLSGPGGAVRERALFGLAVCRYVTRAMQYPDLYRRMARAYEQALVWLNDLPAEGVS